MATVAVAAASSSGASQPWYIVLSMRPPRSTTMYLGWVHYGQKMLHFPRYDGNQNLSDAVKHLQALRVLPKNIEFSTEHRTVGCTRVVHLVVKRHFKQYRSKDTRAYMWCTASEFRGVPALRIAGGVWDCDVDPIAHAIAESMQLPVREAVAYHGTTHAAADSILRHGFRLPHPFQTRLHLEVTASRADGSDGMYLSAHAENALKKPFGMLGQALYMASFAKCTRFAQLDAAGHRESDGGTVLRCVFPLPASVYYMCAGFVCPCCEVRGVDHAGEWRAGASVCVFSDNGVLSSGVEIALASCSGVHVLQRRRIRPRDVPPEPAPFEPLRTFQVNACGALAASTHSPMTPPAAGGGHTPSACAPTSPAYIPTSPAYIPTSPVYIPTSPMYIPTSPAVDNGGQTSPAYMPTSPPLTIGVTSPAHNADSQSATRVVGTGTPTTTPEITGTVPGVTP